MLILLFFCSLLNCGKKLLLNLFLDLLFHLISIFYLSHSIHLHFFMQVYFNRNLLLVLHDSPILFNIFFFIGLPSWVERR